MRPRLDAIGLVVSNLGASIAFYWSLGIDLPDPEEHGHVEATLAGGMRFMIDTIEEVRSFDPDWTSLRESLARGHRRHCSGLLNWGSSPTRCRPIDHPVQHGRPLVHAPEVRQPPLFELFLLGMRTAMTLFVVVLTTLGGKLVERDLRRNTATAVSKSRAQGKRIIFARKTENIDRALPRR